MSDCSSAEFGRRGFWRLRLEWDLWTEYWVFQFHNSQVTKGAVVMVLLSVGGGRAVTKHERRCVGGSKGSLINLLVLCWFKRDPPNSEAKLGSWNTKRTEMKLLFSTRWCVSPISCPCVLPAQKCLYLSQSRTVLTRWAIVNTVLSLNWVLSMDWIWTSVSKSTAAVASSRIRILAFRRSALARQTSCFWPVLQVGREMINWGQ